MKTPKDIIDIAYMRLEEAEHLYRKGLYEGAFYLVGYAVELALKAKICELLNIDNLFDSDRPSGFKDDDLKAFKTHDLKTLILFTGKDKAFNTAKTTNPQLFINWSLVTSQWKMDKQNNCRYLTRGSKTEKATRDLIDAVSNTKNGILPWILDN